MSLRAWVRQHRDTINATIRGAGVTGTINDSDREDWVLNDEGLYRSAQADGVNI
jgi:hypothetical protein